MKKSLFIISLFMLSVLFLGCPYKSKIALDDYAKEKIDKRILGTWITKDTTGADVSAYYTIEASNDFLLDINYYSFKDTTQSETEITEESQEIPVDSLENTESENDVEPSGIFEVTNTYEAFFSDVSGVKYINIRQIDDFTGFGFYIYKISFINNEVVLSPVTNYIKSIFTNSGELKEYVKKYQNIEFFFGDDEIYQAYKIPEN